MRTNALRMAEVASAEASGGLLPQGRLLDSRGRPSRDPGDAATGVLLPDGHRGSGLALVVDLLTAGLAGAPIGAELGPSGEVQTSLFVMALDPDRFAGAAAFGVALERLTGQVRGTPPLDRRRPVRMPGDRGATERARRACHGIPFDRARMDARLRELGLAGEVAWA
jgi:LDH2 family malate/lactate/ureidoglycolate dehydrogenase